MQQKNRKAANEDALPKSDNQRSECTTQSNDPDFPVAKPFKSNYP